MKLVIPPPAGFQIAHLATGPAWLRPASKNMILSLWQKLNPTLPLRLSARRHPKHRIFPGRAPVVVLP
ncbi:MAG: hypothetical protein NTZ01_00460, partial [Verrucomicrobia bacterium]|nr:hypothetical protein [Verrucomicrobiota bacterium]